MAKWLDKYHSGFVHQIGEHGEKIVAFNYHPLLMTIGWLAFCSEGWLQRRCPFLLTSGSGHGVPRLPRTSI
jgi:hypothetical protein